MRLLSPRIWGFSDYPEAITSKVEPQTKRERQIGSIAFIPFLLLMIGIPLISTLILESTYTGQIPLIDAFLNAFCVLMFGNLADLIILDLLIVGTITPSWVIIPGTENLKETEYKAFRKSHTIGHIYGTIFLALLSFAIAVVIVIF